ncbi:glutathione S-transferase family protein [Collimonas sp. NPDC087041]|uniref:glutathione S-transferase family protein n=1 Tax=Collimonas sp. NPDC087041 TaxID=3363960 RepID=UPI00382E286E
MHFQPGRQFNPGVTDIMYQLYIANKNYSSWSLRPWVLLRELGIAFNEQVVPFAEGSNWDAFRGFSPTGKVPALTDGETTVWDSLGIVEYLAERHDGVWPGDPQARAWARCAAAEMHSGFGVLRERCTMNCGIRVQLEEFPAALTQDVDRIDELWQQGLEQFGGPFLAGARFTAVDAFFAPVAFRVQTYGLKLSPAAQNYATRLLNLASMQQWQADALVETWREPGHEAEAKAAGILLQDLRKTIAVKK